jgi:hypothetical protein
VKLLTASAKADANVVADKYGIDISGELSAEALAVKAEASGEIRLTPKALFDNTVGWMTGTTAPDYLDFGPVIGAGVSGGEGGAAIGGSAGMRLGIDEINVRGGGKLGLGEEGGIDFKVGMRLGPLKYLYDQQNAGAPPPPAPCTPEPAPTPAVCSDSDSGAAPVAAAEAPAQGLAEAATSTWDKLFS